MAIGNKSYTVQESINPYFNGDVGTSCRTDSNSVNIPTKAIVKNTDSASVTLTFEDGTTTSLLMIKGVVYPISVITVSAAVLMLY